MAYILEKRVARDPSIFGKGAIEGVAAPESANNAGAQTSFIPMLTLGIPGNAVMAVMVAALMIHGINPGPGVITEKPDLFWGIIASMFIGNVMLVIINLPLIGIWVRLLRIPYRHLYLAIIAFCAIGVYAFRGNPNGAEGDDREVEQAVGNAQQADPDADQRQVDDHQHDVADEHAGDDAPEQVRLLRDHAAGPD